MLTFFDLAIVYAIALVLLILFFISFRFNYNSLNLCVVLIACVPFFNIVLLLILYIVSIIITCNMSSWELDNDLKNNRIIVFLANNKLNRWLFNMSFDELFWKDEYSKRMEENDER